MTAPASASGLRQTRLLKGYLETNEEIGDPRVQGVVVGEIQLSVTFNLVFYWPYCESENMLTLISTCDQER
jgi:hypothetical protein